MEKDRWIQEFLDLYKCEDVTGKSEDELEEYYDDMFSKIENYDLKKHYLKIMDENKECTDLTRWLEYRGANTVDLDGCGRGKNVCMFSRNVYKRLWKFNAEHLWRGTLYYYNFGVSLFDEEISMGPDTMNSVMTPLMTYLKNHTSIWQDYKGKPYIPANQRMITDNYLQIIRENKGEKWYKDYLGEFICKWNEYVMLSGTIGNLTLVPAYFNGYRGRSSKLRDYWDLSLKELKEEGFRRKNYSKDLKSMSKDDFNLYINSFFLWDYVIVNEENQYDVKSLCGCEDEKHLCFDGKKDDVKRFEVFLDNVCRFIKRRSLFMAAMLWLEENYEELYDGVMEEVCRDKVIKGYDEVFNKLIPKVSDKYKLSEDEKKLLDETYKRIEKI